MKNTVSEEGIGWRPLRDPEPICEEPEESGLFGSIRRVLATTLSVVESRIELIMVEAKELKMRALSVLLWGISLLFLGFLIFVGIIGVVVFALWDYALPVLIGFSIFFVVAAIGSFVAARAQLNKIPFGDTVDQLKKDRDLVLKNSSDEDEDWRREGDSNPR